MSARSLVAVLACRNESSRLYGKPLQFLHPNSCWSVLDQVVFNLRSLSAITGIVLAIAEGTDNHQYVDYACRNSLPYVIGDETDVLGRLILGADLSAATDIFRVTSESPFLWMDPVSEAWRLHTSNSLDATFLDDIIDGCGFEIINTDALRLSWQKGSPRHRSELCSLYLRENRDKFSIHIIKPPSELSRLDLRLTIDYPEDLIVCRAVYSHFVGDDPRSHLSLPAVIHFLDSRPDLVSLIQPYTSAGYQSMYL